MAPVTRDGGAAAPQQPSGASIPASVSTVAATGTTAATAGGKRKRIPTAAVDDLAAYFAAQRWSLNTPLPRGATLVKELEAIQQKYSLEKSQIARQLKNYKDKKYGLKDLVLNFDTERIKEILEEGMGMSPSEFVISILSKMSSKDRDLGNRDISNFAAVIDEFPTVVFSLLASFKTEGSLCLPILSRLVEGWTELASEEFPKTIARLPDADMTFMNRNREKKREFIVQWVGLRDTFLGARAILFPEVKYRYFGSFLFDMLFDCWAFSSMEGERPPVMMPEDCLVGKYARPVVYYVAGWTLHSLSLARTVAKGERQIYERFAEQHNIGEESAKEQNMPISLVLKRNFRLLMFCSLEYYKFICFIESVYLDNLTLEMMIGHPEGNIIAVIKSHILGSKLALNKFAGLFGNEGHAYAKDERKLLLNYIMDRYANMRGTYFVKFLRGTQRASITDIQIGSQATRTRVQSKAASSKAVADSKRTEKEVWGSVGESVVEHSSHFDQLEASSE